MRKFLKYSLFFLLLLIAVSFALECLLRQVPNPYKYKYEWMQAHAEDVELLTLGSSHTFYGIHPEVFRQKGFNLANPSQPTELDLFLLKHWADKYHNLKTVIYPISYFTWFTNGLEHGSAAYRCRYYSIYMDYDAFPYLSPYYHFEIAEPVTARLKIHDILFGPSCNPDWSCDKYGSSSYNNYSETNFGKGEDNVNYEHTKTWDYVEKNYNLMKEMAEFCKKRDIQLILVTTPCWLSYRERLNQQQLTKMYEITHRFQKEYNLIYLDYLKDQRFQKEDFYNNSHLSDIGAIKFTKILDEDINCQIVNSKIVK